MTKRTVGLDFDPVQPTACLGSEVGDAAVHAALSDFPAAYVASPLPEGPLALDYRWPASNVGTGLGGESDPHLRRIPLAYAFELLLAAPESHIEGAMGKSSASGPTTAEALGSAAEELLAQTADPQSRAIAVAVPNAIQEFAQDRLLRGLRRGLQARGRTGDTPSLVWRPVAAALQWIEKFGEQLPSREGEDRQSIGRLLHVHLGFEAWESTVLEVVRYHRDGVTWILPGRRKPQSSDLVLQVPLAHFEALAKSTLPAVVQQPVARQTAMAWHAYWLSSLLSEVCGTGQSTNQHLPWLTPASTHQMRLEFLRRIKAAAPTQPRWLPRLRNQAGVANANLSHWLRGLDTAARAGLVGAVVSGPLAKIPNGASSFGADLLPSHGIHLERALIDVEEGRSLVAEGAMAFALRRENGEPTYLDTLPKVKTILNVRGEPAWHDLLAGEHEWVPGGKTWQSEDDSFRYQIDRGQRELELVIHREGAATCRRVAIQFDRTTTEACPVALHIEIEPGQGNPRVEVVPEDRLLFRGRRLQLDWNLATDTQRNPEDEIKSVPRACPPAEPRGACRWQWLERSFPDPTLNGRGLRSVVADYLTAPHRWTRRSGDRDTPRNLRLLRMWFRWPRRGEAAAAASSEGRVYGSDADQLQLDRFVRALVDRIPTADQATRRELIVTLGATSTALPEALSLLRSQLAQADRRQSFDRQAIVYACGNCFRNPEDLGSLYQYWNRREWPDYVDAESLAACCLYRELALEHAESASVEQWLAKLCRMLATDPKTTRVPRPLIRAALAIGCLMRRRIWDRSFLSPGSHLHNKVKAAVSLAKARITSLVEARIIPSTPSAWRAIAYLEVVIKYLDRRGHGGLGPMLQEDEEAEE
jgi:hypothetical protein